MSLPGLNKLRFTGDAKGEDLNRVQDNVGAALAPVVAEPILDGRLLTSQALSATETQVAHGLGRTPLGWLVADRGANATVWRSSAMTPTVLPLTASGAVTVSLWVF